MITLVCTGNGQRAVVSTFVTSQFPRFGISRSATSHDRHASLIHASKCSARDFSNNNLLVIVLRCESCVIIMFLQSAATAPPLRLDNANEASIAFENVRFRYKDSNDIFKKLDFTVQPGKAVALVGGSGSGYSA